LSAQAHIGSLAHAARHENDNIGFFNGLDMTRPKRLEHAHDTFGIVLVHLASERMDAETQIVEN
jgi:hypothetical protein